MTKPRDPDALLSAYLADGMEVLPDRVVDSVLDEVHRTRQRAVFGPWRTRSMSRTALGAAAVVAVLALGGAFFVIQRGQPAVGGPSPTPSASVQPQPARRRWSKRDAHGDAEPDAHADRCGPKRVWMRTGPRQSAPSPSETRSSCRIVRGGRRTSSVADPLGDTGSDVHPGSTSGRCEGNGSDCIIELVRTPAGRGSHRAMDRVRRGRR